MTFLGILQKTAPHWVNVVNKKNKLAVTARALKPSGAIGTIEYKLLITRGDKQQINIKEYKEQSKLPRSCSERHINSDSTFCLHLGSSSPELNQVSAGDWWKSLGYFLNNQEYANKHRKWPMNAQLCHGKAAEIQLEMEEIAQQHGWKNEITSSIFRHKGWLVGRLPRLRQDNQILLYRNSPCPRGCKIGHNSFHQEVCQINKCAQGCKKKHHPIVLKNCRHRESLKQLIILENKRRTIEKDFILHLQNEKIECCGTMDNCPLNHGSVAKFSKAVKT